jgi:hypothetical protein
MKYVHPKREIYVHNTHGTICLFRLSQQAGQPPIQRKQQEMSAELNKNTSLTQVVKSMQEIFTSAIVRVHGRSHTRRRELMNGCQPYRIVADLVIHGDGERGSHRKESLYRSCRR